MRVRDITTDMPFRFVGSDRIYIARGEGWYSSPEGHDGGPWTDDEREVEKVTCSMHSKSFLGMENHEVLDYYESMMRGPLKDQRTDGDRAMARYTMTCRGVVQHEF